MVILQTDVSQLSEHVFCKSFTFSSYDLKNQVVLQVKWVWWGLVV